MTEPVAHQIYCRYCVAHCGLIVEVDGGEVTGVRGDRAHPVSQGYTCAKGRSVVTDHTDELRLDHPLRRTPQGEAQVRVTWEAALEEIAGKVGDLVEREGPDSVGLFVGTGGSHDAAGRRLAVKWLRALGSRSHYSSATVDAPNKPLVAELVTGNAALFSPVIDFERATLTVLVGSNPLVSHGHTTGWPNPRAKLRKLMANGELWVVDPVRTETAKMATRHLPPRVGTDHVWLAAVARELLGDADREELALRAVGVQELETALAPFTLERAAQESQLALGDLKDLLAAIRSCGRIAMQSGTGVSMSAAAPVSEWLLWVIQIITDSLDQEGGSWFNPGFLRATDRTAGVTGHGDARPGPESRPDLPGRMGELPSVAIVDEIEAGNLKALVVSGGNLVTALPQTPRVLRALRSLDVLVVLDVIENEMTRLGSHVLPCAGQLERADLPFITDMYLPAVATQYAGPVVQPTEERRPMWHVIADLGERLGLDLLDGLGVEAATEDDVLRPLTSRSHMTLDELRDRPGGHVADESRFGWVRQSVLPSGKWRIAPQQLVDRLEELSHLPAPDGLRLSPRRQLRQLNSQLTRSGTADGRVESAMVVVHPLDAEARGVRDGNRVQVTSAHGSLEGQAVLDATIARGCVSIPHGHADVNPNNLTSAAHDIEPLTGMMLSSGTRVELSPLP